MNERIAELAELAAQETATEDNDVNLEVSVNDDTYQIPGNFIEKFAELIIQECATLAYDGPGGILDHFGVEDAPTNP
jgi:hypothetical protein